MTPAWALLCGLELAAIVALGAWCYVQYRMQELLVRRMDELFDRADASDAFDKEMKVRLDKALRESK